MYLGCWLDLQMYNNNYYPLFNLGTNFVIIYCFIIIDCIILLILATLLLITTYLNISRAG